MNGIGWIKLAFGSVLPWLAALFQKRPPAPPGMKWELIPFDFQTDYFQQAGKPGSELRKVTKKASKT